MTHPTCAQCWPPRFRRPEDFDPSACFIVCAIRSKDAPLPMRVDLAHAIDATIDQGLPGWMGDTAAHMSANLTQEQVDVRAGIADVMQLLLSATEGIGSVVTASTDGKGHALRCHRQDGNCGNSEHAAHHDGFLSEGRYLTGVISAAASQHANWRLARQGCGSTTIVLPDGSRIYILLFAASANAMATHAVEPLPPTPTDAPPRLYAGAAERYSLSFSLGLTDEWAVRGERAAMAEIVRLLCDLPRFEHVCEIPAMHCEGGLGVGHREMRISS
jgi:hypothetical protein